NIFNVRNRGIKLSKDLSVLKHTKMAACLVEVDFISNIAAESDLKVENNINAVAIAIKNNLVQLFSLEVATTDTLYKVCIGAYRDKNNALNQLKLAKDKGFKDTYII
ncbi:MAG: N-acetylmuramoyl-L-alanine amidase, partial [Peptostreptococcaceae bacterium]